MNEKGIPIMNGLHIVILPGGSTAQLQPLDKAIFKVFKQKLRERMTSVIEESDGRMVKKEKFTKIDTITIAQEILQELLTTERIKNAFECTGIEPFSPLTIIEKINKRKQPELLNDELKEILAPTIIINKPEKNKGSKRIKRAQCKHCDIFHPPQNQ